VAWVRDQRDKHYQINADDVYVQVGQHGLWDFMAGRFLTWRVFRKGLGFDLYTLEDTGARISLNFTDPGADAVFPHMYEVNTIFMRDPSMGPVGRAALHVYPHSWAGIELVGTYGHLDGGQNVFGGRVAAGIQPKDFFLLEHFNLLAGAEYQGQSPDRQMAGCNGCSRAKDYGVGGSLGFAWRPIDLAFSAAQGKHENWDQFAAYTNYTIRSLGGYLQLDAGSLFMDRSLIVGGAFFRTEYNTEDDLYKLHDQIAAYLAYPLGFKTAVVKLVLSQAHGYQQPRNPPNTDGYMYSARLRFAYYY
jgi:hypothetical protein